MSIAAIGNFSQTLLRLTKYLDKRQPKALLEVIKCISMLDQFRVGFKIKLVTDYTYI